MQHESKHAKLGVNHANEENHIANGGEIAAQPAPEHEFGWRRPFGCQRASCLSVLVGVGHKSSQPHLAQFD